MSMRIAVFSIVLAIVAGVLFFWIGRDEEPGAPRVAAAGAVARAGSEVTAARGAADLSSPGTTAAADSPAAERRAPAAGAPTAEEAEGSAPADARFAGRVVDRFGNPLADAALTFAPERSGTFGLRRGDASDELHATSDADGRFEVPVAGAAPWRASVRVSGFAPFRASGLVARAEGVTELEPFALTPGAILRGRVIDADARAVAGARLFVEDRHSPVRIFGGDREPDVVSDAQGAFSIEYLDCGPWRVRVESDEHPTDSFEGLAERPGQVVSGLEFALPRGSRIDGRLTGVPDDVELSELEVRAYPVGDEGFWATLGPSVRRSDIEVDGSFRLRGLRKDARYRIQARKSRATRGLFGASQSLSEAVEATPGANDVVLVFQPEASVAVRVVDADTGAPIERMDVAGGFQWPAGLRDADGRLQREFEDGRVRFADLRKPDAGDRFKLEIRAVGYEPYSRDDILIVPGQEVDLGQVALRSVPVVQVTVLDGSGRPVEGARAILTVAEEDSDLEGGTRMRIGMRIEEDSDGETIVRGGDAMQMGRTDAEGVALLTSFQGRRCELRVEADGFAPARLTDLHLPEGRKQDYEVVLSPGASIEVTVLSAEGQPMPGVEVEHRSPSGASQVLHPGPRAVTDADGRTRFEHLSAGVHGFRIGAEGNAGGWSGERFVVQVDGVETGGDWTEIEVRENDEQELLLRMSERGELRGRVLEAGLPLAGAKLSLRPKKDESPQERAMRLAGFGGGGPQTRTDGDGDYRVEALEAGTWLLEISHPTRQMPDEFEVDIAAGRERFDVDLAVSIIEGRITDPNGQPVVGARVETERVRPEGEPRATAMRVVMVAEDGDTQVSIDSGETPEFGYTDADGRYKLRGVQSGVPLVVKGSHASTQPGESESVEVAEGEVLTGVDFELAPGGGLRVTAKRADGSDAGFQMVLGEYLGEEPAQGPVEDQRGFIGPSGDTTLSGLRPGTWRVSLTPMGPDGGGEPVSQEVEVRAGETGEVPFSL